MPIKHPNALLFHCWRHEPLEQARRIFTSIVNKGFLLTTTNAGALDSFVVRDGRNELRKIEVMQRPRICFTDMPIDQLPIHGAAYGTYGMGFSRETIIEWGGCPAWYLPNHHGGDTLKDNGPLLVNGLHAAMTALDSFHAVVRETEELLKQGKIQQRFFTQKFTHGDTLVGDALLNWIAHGRGSVDRALSFVNEMSPPNSEDFRYLYEREWRLVEGIEIRGRNPCRLLTNQEKVDLCKSNPSWREVPRVTDINIQVRYPAAPIVDSFRIFPGIAGINVSQRIEIVLVPNEAEKEWVQAQIAINPSAFKIKGPEVLVFPS
jgi:hypothetical protein